MTDCKGNVRLAWIQPSFKESVKAQHCYFFCVLKKVSRVKKCNGFILNTETMIY